MHWPAGFWSFGWIGINSSPSFNHDTRPTIFNEGYVVEPEVFSISVRIAMAIAWAMVSVLSI